MDPRRCDEDVSPEVVRGADHDAGLRDGVRRGFHRRIPAERDRGHPRALLFRNLEGRAIGDGLVVLRRHREEPEPVPILGDVLDDRRVLLGVVVRLRVLLHHRRTDQRLFGGVLDAVLRQGVEGGRLIRRHELRFPLGRADVLEQARLVHGRARGNREADLAFQRFVGGILDLELHLQDAEVLFQPEIHGSGDEHQRLVLLGGSPGRARDAQGQCRKDALHKQFSLPLAPPSLTHPYVFSAPRPHSLGKNIPVVLRYSSYSGNAAVSFRSSNPRPHGLARHEHEVQRDGVRRESARGCSTG